MGRSFQAYLLIAAISLSASANLAAVLAGNSASTRMCPPGCCGKAGCPMRAHKRPMPMKCPMRSMAGHHQMAMSCTCAMSQQDAPIVPASSFELRYDLPPSHELIIPKHAALIAADTFVQTLDGFFLPPDQPPKSLAA